MNKRRTAITSFALVAGLGALSGCSAAGAGSDSGQLTYWSMWTESEPQAAAIQSAIDAFETKTGITVSVQWQGRKVLDQVAAGLAAGSAPDLVDQAFDALGPSLNSQNALADLSDVWDMQNEDGEKVSDAVNKDIAQGIPDYGGDVKDFMIPYTVSTVSLFYNAAGPYVSKAPETYDELLAICEAAKADGVGCIASDADAAWASEYWFDYLLDREAGDGSVGELFRDTSGASWDRPEVKRVAEQVKGLVDKGFMSASYDASQYPAARDGWAQGKSVFYLTGSWVVTETKDLVDAGWTYGGANFPVVDDKANDSLSILPFGFAVPSAANNPDAAKQFIAFFSSKEYAGKIATEAGNLTALKNGPAPTNLEGVQKDLDSTSTRIAFDGSNGQLFAKVFDSAFNDLWLGKSTPQEFIEASKKGQIDYWKSQG